MKVFIFAAFAILFAVARGQGPPPLLPDPVTMDFSGRWGKAINGTVYQDCLLMCVLLFGAIAEVLLLCCSFVVCDPVKQGCLRAVL